MPLSVPEPSSLPGWDPANPADVVDPGSTIKTTGFQASDALVPTHHNWLFKTISDWIEYLQSVTNDLFGAEHTVTGADGGKHTAINANSLTWRTNRQVYIDMMPSPLIQPRGGAASGVTYLGYIDGSDISWLTEYGFSTTAAVGDQTILEVYVPLTIPHGPDDGTTAQWSINAVYANYDAIGGATELDLRKRIKILSQDRSARSFTTEYTATSSSVLSADTNLYSSGSTVVDPTKLYFVLIEIRLAAAASGPYTYSSTVIYPYGVRVGFTRHRIE